MRRITKSGSLGYWLLYALAWPLSVLRLILLARKTKANVIHSNSLHSWYGWAVAFVLRRPHLWHAREITFQSSAALRLERFLTSHFADEVICVSSAVAAQFPTSPCVVIYDQPDPAFTPLAAGTFRERCGLRDDALILGAAGRIDTWKGFDVLLDAYELLRLRRPEVQLLIAGAIVQGKEEFARALQTRADALEGVRWLGHRDDMAAMFADLDLFVLPSVEPEPFGMVLSEALACGVPVVATNHGGPPEMLRGLDAATAALVPPRDTVALCDALDRLLGPGPSSTAQRRARTAHSIASGETLSELVDRVSHSTPAERSRQRRASRR